MVLIRIVTHLIEFPLYSQQHELQHKCALNNDSFYTLHGDSL